MIPVTMHNKLLKLLMSILCLSMASGAFAQAVTDSIFNPPVIYTAMPKVYEIADIAVEGNGNYDAEIVLGYTGLKVGERVAIIGRAHV